MYKDKTRHQILYSDNNLFTDEMRNFMKKILKTHFFYFHYLVLKKSISHQFLYIHVYKYVYFYICSYVPFYLYRSSTECSSNVLSRISDTRCRKNNRLEIVCDQSELLWFYLIIFDSIKHFPQMKSSAEKNFRGLYGSSEHN